MKALAGLETGDKARVQGRDRRIFATVIDASPVGASDEADQQFCCIKHQKW
jgi:hypothetical protein